ncbi:MAG: hypothetical protein K6F33_07730 [Bacteroidales bacterium]|nr:hypothetical protein [Bacteroidales bacterium]
MKTLDFNQKARIADYINGRPVKISDEELQMLADDDQLASECIEIAEIAEEASQQTVATSSKNSGKLIRMVILAAAACLVIAIAIPLFTKSNAPASNTTAEQQSTTPRKRSMGLLSAKSLDKGYYEMPEEFAKMIQSASTKGFFDFEPETPFDIMFSTSIEPDTLYLYSPRVKTPLITIPVSGESATISPGLASGLYYYYLKYNLKERNAIAIGSDNE